MKSGPRSGPPTESPDNWFAQSADDVLTAFASSRDGLSTERSAEILATHGRNEIPTRQRFTALQIVLAQLRSPLIYLLLVAGVVTLFLREWNDAAAIGVVVVVNSLLGFFQEYRAENSVRALLALAAPVAQVRRNGWTRDIPSAEVVPGDIVILEQGARVPADLRLVDSASLKIDESILTGESVPVSKTTDVFDGGAAVPIPERLNLAFSGSIVASGRGLGVVVATGLQTELGKIAGQLSEPVGPKLPLEQRIQSLSRLIAAAIVVASVLTFIIGLATGQSLSEMFLATVALAVSAIPEGLPVAVTVALAIGVRRMAAKNALVRRLIGVETLGSCTVVMSDKTGTLTQNRMTVERIFAGGTLYSVSGPPDSVSGSFTDVRTGAVIDDPAALRPLAKTLAAGVPPNSGSLRLLEGEVEMHGDPTELALLVSAARAGISEEKVVPEGAQVRKIPFDSEARYSACIVGSGEDARVYVMGAPEVVVEMCATQVGDRAEEPVDRAEILLAASSLAQDGMRLLAMAVGRGEVAADSVLHGRPAELAFAGLQGMHDPPRPEAMEALRGCRAAGIRVLMVTGDHADTALAIARQLELETRADAPVVTGEAISAMSDEELSEMLRSAVVFARVDPTQKRRIVELLTRQGEIVGVTGDGVNDAPAIAAAHLGLAMGRRGTDVAKEASDIILLDDNFATVYAAVVEGRTAFANVRNVTYFLVVSGIAEVLAIMIALALTMPLPMLPIQLLWLNMVTNGIQDVGLAFEPGEHRHRSLPPRRRAEGILSRTLTNRAFLVGVVMAAVTVAIFAAERESGRTLAYAQTAALTTLVLGEAMLVGTSRSEVVSVFRKNPLSNPLLLIGTALALALHIGAVYSPPGHSILGLERLDGTSWAWIIVAASSSLIVAEVHKLFKTRRGKLQTATAATV